MADDHLLRRVQEVLASAEFDADSGRHLHPHAHAYAHSYGVSHICRAGPLVRTAVEAHPDDSDIDVRAAIPGIRPALEVALVATLRAAGLKAVPPPPMDSF